jgi:hypothetical protein
VSLRRVVPRVMAIVVAILALLPIANWIPGGPSAPWYQTAGGLWLTGTGIALGAGVVLAILSRQFPVLWREGLLEPPARWVARHPAAAVALLTVASLALYAWLAVALFDARPLLIDEIVQVMHAKFIAAGRLTGVADPNPEFFSTLHVIDEGGKYYSHFPIGGPAMLAVGELIGAPWLVGPLSAAGAVAAFCWMLGAIEPRPGVRVGAALLFAFAPFTAFMAASHMNHVPTLLWLVVAIAALSRMVTSERGRPGAALVCGLGFGLAATVRPGDAVAFALPAAAWLVTRAVRDTRRIPELLVCGVGVAIPIALLLWANSATTGSPLLFAYEALWGKHFALGFGTSSSGVVHTPLNGLELVNIYMLRLGAYLFESPVNSLLPAIATLWLTRRWAPFDAYLAASAALLVALYSAYWHEGLHLGPRLLYPLAPILALATARSLPAIREAVGHGVVWRTVVFGALAAAVIGAATILPIRITEYGTMLSGPRWDADRAARMAGVDGALVFVRESWGSQLIARMWALGVPRPDTERLYYRVDACALENAIGRLERDGTRGDAATRALLPLMADSARLVRGSFSPDSSIRALPGARYDSNCIARIQDDREGFMPLAPLLLARSGNVYVRDLHARNQVMLDRYPERAVYLLRPSAAAVAGAPVFHPLSRDSLSRAWTR